jgi:gliding motility-associated-like protein
MMFSIGDFSFKKIIFFAIIFILGRAITFAQMPNCSSIYIHASDGGFTISNWDPAQPFSPTNPIENTIVLPGIVFFETQGLAVASGISPTNGTTPVFYTSLNGHYSYYNGTTWINTTHLASAINLGGGVGVIYAFDGVDGVVYKYDGTGDDVPLITITDFDSGGPFDVVVDCANNFYILKQTTPGAWLRKYSPTGVMLQQWTVTGAPNLALGGGFAILGNTIYTTSGGLFSGTIGGTTIAFTQINNPPESIFGADYASCPFSIQPAVIPSYDTVYACSASTNITSSGLPPYSYQVINGNAAVTSTGPVFTVTPTTPTTLVLRSTGNDACMMQQVVTDTFLVVPAPHVNAGMDDTIIGCGTFMETLNGSTSNGISWINYSPTWTPTASITTGINTLTPTIHPTANTIYTLTVTTDNTHGNCILKDSVSIAVNDQSPSANFSFMINKGCVADTVVLTNLSQNANQYYWDFGDGFSDTTSNPTHIYNTQGNYNVRLNANNPTCKDSVLKIVDTRHPLSANFTVSKDTICQNTTINFTNTSTVSTQPAAYNWNFGDGSAANTMNPSHTYPNAGVYQVAQIVSDAIPCYDTAYHIIVVDSISTLNFTESAHSACIGTLINFSAPNQGATLNDLSWDFDDGTVISNLYNLHHAYDKEGIYFVNLTATFRVCPELNFKDSVIVYPFPNVYLGPDTSICLDGNPIILSNKEVEDTTDSYTWSTGATTANLKIVHHGNYSLTVTNTHDCSTTDEIIVAKDCYVDIPNSFTPNNDGVNDYFFPRQLLSSGITDFTMQVFNRWGQVIFETTNANGSGWDGKFNGKDQPQGVFIYRIHVIFKNGRMEKYDGNVTLIR